MGFPESCWALLTDSEKTIGRVALTFRIWHEEGEWQGICSELKVPSFGDDPGDTLTNVIDATICYLNEIERTGERARVFQERGLTLRDGDPDDDEKVEGSDAIVSSNEGVSRIDVGLMAAVA